MYNKSQLSRDHKAAKEPKKIARPKDKFVIPGAPKVDPNGYWDPANVGRIIEVPLNEDSRSITMSYPDGTPLDQPLIGIGTDTGMMQYMMPGGEYIFPYDSSVIEGPTMEAGGTIMDLTDDEIKMYRDAGYVVDLTPYPERHNPANAFSVKDPRSMQLGGSSQDGGIPRAQKGFAVPTRADSLELYKQSLYLDKWMKENKYMWDTTHLKKHSPHWIGKDLLSHLKAVYNQDKAEKQKSKPFSAYVKTKGNLIGTSDWIAGGLEDYGLPFTWKHPYIAAQYEGDMAPMENTGPRPYSYSFRYDPVAIKPGDMLTDEEVKKRVKKYGTKGIPESKLEKLGIINKPKSNVVKVNNPSKVNIETNQVDENGNVVSSQEYYDFPPITMPTRKAQTIDVNTPLPEIATNEQTIIKRYDPEQNKWIIDEVNTTDPSVKEYQDAVNWARKNPQKRKSSLFITPEEYAEYQNAKKRKAEIAKQFLKGMATGGTIMDLTDDQIKMYRDAGYVIEDMPSAQNGQTTSSPMSYFDRMQPYTDRFGNPIDLDKLKLQEGPVKFNYNEKTGIIQTNEGTFTPEQYIKEITPEGYSIAKIKSDFGENRYKYYYIGPDYEEVNKNLKMYSKGKETYPIYSNVPYDKRIQQWRAEDAAEEVPTQRTGGYVNKQITHFQDGGFTEKDRLKQKLLNRYPGFKKALGTEGENLHIIADPNFKAREHGYGDIEVMFPDVDQIDYTSDYTYKSPFPGDYVIPYNPNSSINKGDIFLDMLHLLRNDKGIEPYIDKFRTAAIDQRGGDIMWAWEEEKQNPDFINALESSGTNAFDQFEKNYIDGLLRSELSRLGMGRRTTDEGYKIERSTNSPEMRRAAKDIYKYLKTKQDGGNTDPGNNALELHMFYDKNKFQNGGTNILQTSNSPLDLFKANEFKPFIEDQPYTFAGRPGSYYKMVNGKMQIKNKDTDWKYVEMKDPTGKRYKTLLAGLESGSTKAYEKPTTTINDFYYSKEELKKQQVSDRAVQCLRDTDGNCLGSAFLYYDKYVAPNLGLKSSWELKEEAGLTSGKKGNPNYRNWGESIDSWELRGAFGDKAKQYYAAPLDNQYELYDKLQGMTDAEKDKYFRDMNLPIGTIIQGGFEGYDEDREMPGQSYNEEKGYVPSHHSGIVVGYDDYGTPIIYDYGGVRKITDPDNLLMSSDYAINNIYAPNQNVQQTYEYLKKGNKLRQNVTPLNIEIPGIGLLSDINEMQPFIDQLESNKQAVMDAFNLTDSEYNELSKIATATALAETKGGQDLGTFRYGIPTYLTDKMGLGESQGITQINPAAVWAKTDKDEWRDPGLVNRLEKFGITEDTYDPWNSKHQAIVTIGLTNSNLKTAKENASINPNVSKDLTDAELAYYQWNIPSALTTNDYEKAAKPTAVLSVPVVLEPIAL